MTVFGMEERKLIRAGGTLAGGHQSTARLVGRS